MHTARLDLAARGREQGRAEERATGAGKERIRAQAGSGQGS